MKFKQTVLVEFKNTEPFTYEMESVKPITLDRVVKYFKITDNWNEERDSIIMLDGTTVVNLDELD
jgi:hypothetical protein